MQPRDCYLWTVEYDVCDEVVDANGCRPAPEGWRRRPLTQTVVSGPHLEDVVADVRELAGVGRTWEDSDESGNTMRTADVRTVSAVRGPRVDFVPRRHRDGWDAE